jgi:hypothetical protein
MRYVTMEKDLPPYAAETVQRVKELGFGWRFSEHCALAEPGKRIQVRNIKYLAPPGEVSRYAQSLRHGDLMPPVIMTADKYLVDGHTRTEAARKIGWDTFQTIVLDVKYEDITAPMYKQLLKLGTGFNNTHGRAMNAQNLADLIEQIADEDERPRDLARELHLPDNMTATVVNAVKARRRANALGVTLTGVLSNSHLKMFGAKSDRYTGPVFMEMLALSQDARLTTPQVFDLMKRVDGVDTEAGRMALLRSERDAFTDVIRQYRGRSSDVPRRAPSRSGKLRQYLGYLVNTAPDKLVELNLAEAEHHLASMENARENLNKVIDLQKNLNATRNER